MSADQPVDMGSKWPFDQAPNVAAVSMTTHRDYAKIPPAKTAKKKGEDDNAVK